MRKWAVTLPVGLIIVPIVLSAAARDPDYKSALFFSPCRFAVPYDGELCRATMRSQGRDCLVLENTSGTYPGPGEYPHCGINTFQYYLQNPENRGVIHVLTHGQADCGTHEAYRIREERDSAIVDHVLLDGWDPDDLIETEFVGGWGIGLSASAIREDFSGGNQELVLYQSCHSRHWIDDAYSDARCEVACRDSCGDVRFSQFLRRLDGQEGQSRRIVEEALVGLEDTLVAYGDKATNLAPSVLEVSPPPAHCLPAKLPGTPSSTPRWTPTSKTGLTRSA